MTPGALRQQLHFLDRSLTWPAETEALLPAVEARASSDPAWTEVLVQLVLQMTAADGLEDVVAGVRREELVRWDSFSTTWTGHTAEGGRAMVRVMRPEAGPVHRRILERDGRALSALIPGLQHGPALVAPLHGAPITPGKRSTTATLRLLGTGLEALARWDGVGLGLPDPAPHELVAEDTDVRVVCLTPRRGSWAPAIALLAHCATFPADTPLYQLVEGLRTMPHGTPKDALSELRMAMSRHLAQETVELSRRRLLRGHEGRLGRLVHVLGRLHRAVPPPTGRGAVGVDLEGHTTAVVSTGAEVSFGPVGSGVVIYDPDAGFRAAEARRLLRAFASAPDHSDLHQEIEGDPAFTDAIGRWVSAGLKLRTLRLLADKQAR